MLTKHILWCLCQIITSVRNWDRDTGQTIEQSKCWVEMHGVLEITHIQPPTAPIRQRLVRSYIGRVFPGQADWPAVVESQVRWYHRPTRVCRKTQLVLMCAECFFRMKTSGEICSVFRTRHRLDPSTKFILTRWGIWKIFGVYCSFIGRVVIK